MNNDEPRWIDPSELPQKRDVLHGDYHQDLMPSTGNCVTCSSPKENPERDQCRSCSEDFAAWSENIPETPQDRAVRNEVKLAQSRSARIYRARQGGDWWPDNSPRINDAGTGLEYANV